MSCELDERLLQAVLESWDRNNTILLNLLQALEDAPEFARRLPEKEWVADPDPAHIASTLNESATHSPRPPLPRVPRVKPDASTRQLRARR